MVVDKREDILVEVLHEFFAKCTPDFSRVTSPHRAEGSHYIFVVALNIGELFGCGGQFIGLNGFYVFAVVADLNYLLLLID